MTHIDAGNVKRSAHTSTHTPGPWEAKRGHISEYAWHIGKRALNGSLDMIADLEDSVPQLDEREANAHLIAAAPSTLIALEAMVAMVDNMPTDFEEDMIVVEAKKAIALSRGGIS